MTYNFDIAFGQVVDAEGGYSNDPHDRGNWTSGQVDVGELKGTKFGISAMSYPSLDIISLTLTDAKKIYHSDYWNPCKCDQLIPPLDILVFDSSVNQGVETAIMMLQNALNVTRDGIIGNKTLAAATKQMHDAADDVIANFMSYRALAYVHDNDFQIYGHGWLKRLFKLTYNNI